MRFLRLGRVRQSTIIELLRFFVQKVELFDLLVSDARMKTRGRYWFSDYRISFRCEWRFKDEGVIWI